MTISAVVVLLVAGAAIAGLVINNRHDASVAKHKKQVAAAAASAAAARSAANAAAASASAAAAARSAEDAITRNDRKSLIDALEASVTKDAKKDVNEGVLDGPIKKTECDPTNGSSDLLTASNTFECTAVTKISSDGTESGYVFSATVNWTGESYSWHLGR
ncbi:hypothetical protein [uncultured Jatrophihabitans sp.]|uniref:hypothetical protein n=1 Tax=uncultured Jatrophihabitans sp. TaxID=1610747 RepID=UPI0035CB85F4